MSSEPGRATIEFRKSCYALCSPGAGDMHIWHTDEFIKLTKQVCSLLVWEDDSFLFESGMRWNCILHHVTGRAMSMISSGPSVLS